MIELLSTMQVVLQEAGFDTRLAPLERLSTVCFEDNALMGFGCVFDQPGALLSQWKTAELSLLKRYAPSFRLAGDKAWNVYCVFLCASSGSPSEMRQIRWIEEDLNHTRKVAACGIGSREELVRALLPVLPLQYQPDVRPEDATERLTTRIRTIAPHALEVVLDEGVAPAEVVPLLGSRS